MKLNRDHRREEMNGIGTMILISVVLIMLFLSALISFIW